MAAGGRGGIRTHGSFNPSTVFKTAAINHSATPPRVGVVGPQSVAPVACRGPHGHGPLRRLATQSNTDESHVVAAILLIALADSAVGCRSDPGTPELRRGSVAGNGDWCKTAMGPRFPAFGATLRRRSSPMLNGLKAVSASGFASA